MLHLAALQGHNGLSQLLIEHDTDVNANAIVEDLYSDAISYPTALRITLETEDIGKQNGEP